MKDRVEETIKTYQENFDKYVARTVTEPSGEFKEWMDQFLSHIPEGGKILEIGSATGRDARYFRSLGYSVFCTDVVPQALSTLANDGFETSIYDFRDDPPKAWIGQFDGFFANAVLLHAPEQVFEKALANILEILKKDSVAAFSLKTGEGDEVSFEKMGSPRYFLYHNREELEDKLKKLPFEIVRLALVDRDKWLHTIIAKRQTNASARKSEGVDN